MIRFERTHDPALVRQAIANPKTYAAHCFDGAPSIEAFEPIMSDAIWYVAAYEADWLGIFMFVPQNPVLWEVHTCLLPKAWGRAVEIAQAAVAWVFANTPCRHIITHVPEDNTLAYRLAVGAGFEHYCTLRASFQRGGALISQFLLGKVA